MTSNKGVNRTFLVTLIIYVAVAFLYSFFTRGKDTSIYVQIFFSQASIFLPAFFYIKKSGMKIRELIPYQKLRLGDIPILIIITYLFYPVVLVLNLFSMLFADNQVAEMTQRMNGEELWLNLLFFAVLPACVEEFFFRGMLYQTYRKSSAKIGMFLSGFLFGCMHLNFNQFLYAFAFGIFLVLIVEATGSVYASMLCHFILNINSVIVMKIQSGRGGSASADSAAILEDKEMLLTGSLSWLVIALIALMGVFGLWVYLAKKHNTLMDIQMRFRQPKREKFITPSLIAGIVIAMIIIILSGVKS